MHTLVDFKIQFYFVISFFSLQNKPWTTNIMSQEPVLNYGIASVAENHEQRNTTTALSQSKNVANWFLRDKWNWIPFTELRPTEVGSGCSIELLLSVSFFFTNLLTLKTIVCNLWGDGIIIIIDSLDVVTWKNSFRKKMCHRVFFLWQFNCCFCSIHSMLGQA